MPSDYEIPNYEPGNTIGGRRRHIWRITCENPLVANSDFTQSFATFHEQDVILDINGIERSLGRTDDIVLHYTDPNIVMPLLNPADGTVIGSTTLGAVLVAIYTLSRYAQSQRDEKIINTPSAEN